MARRDPYRTNTGVHIEWFTVRKSTLYLLFASIVCLLAAGVYGYFEVYGEREPAPAPVEIAADNSAHFLELNGSVKVRKAGTYVWMDANMGIKLARDDTIQTVGGSSARVRLFDGTEYLVKPDSILVIEESYEDPDTKAKRVAVKLEVGQVNLKTPRQSVTGSTSGLQTPTTAATFDEMTSAEVAYDTNNKKTGFTVFSGRTDLEAGGQKMSLSSAQAVDITADARFTEIVTLPGVPMLQQPSNLSRVPLAKTTEFQWRSVDGARKYRVQLDRTPYFTDPILDSQVKGVNVVHQGLTEGVYYWQVRAIDADNRAGAPSEFAKFTVSRAPAPVGDKPSLTVYKPTITVDGLVTVRGKTEVGVVLMVDTGMGDHKIQIKSDGSFTHYFQVTEAGRYPVTVKARKREGGGTAEATVYAEIGTD